MGDYDYKEIINKIQKIEDGYPIETLCYKGINFWPLIKSGFNADLLTNNFVEKPNTPKKNSKQKIGDIILSFKNWRAAKKELNMIKAPEFDFNKKKIIYLSYSSFRNQFIGNHYYNSLSDSFANSVKKRDDLAIIEFISHNINNKPTLENIIEGEYLSSLARTNQKKQQFIQYCRALFSNQLFDAGGFPYEKFESYMKLKHPDVHFISGHFFYNAEYILQLKKIFKKLFENTDIKYFVTPVYYNQESLAALLACKELNITSIEVQHGAYSKAMYRLSENDYKMLPDYFFSWDVEQAESINKWRKTKSLHKAFSFGIPALSFWQKNKNLFSNQHFIKTQNTIREKANHIHVLYTVSEFFEERIASLIALTKGTVYWHIRKHPRQSYSEEKEFIAELTKNDCSNYDIENATGSPLYSLLAEMEYNITSASSTVCEALVFQIPTIVINKSGRFLFEDYSNNPRVHFIENITEILALIKCKTLKKKINSYSTLYFEDFLSTHNR